MKSLIEKIFKRDAQLDYIIAEYKPSNKYASEKRAKLTDYDDGLPEDKDEMAIDNLYQRN